jgi:hypothetical protein
MGPLPVEAFPALELLPDSVGISHIVPKIRFMSTGDRIEFSQEI